jgi:L-asparaginase
MASIIMADGYGLTEDGGRGLNGRRCTCSACSRSLGSLSPSCTWPHLAARAWLRCLIRGRNRLKLKFITTGGTIDKVYFDAKSEYEVGSPQIVEILKEAHATFEFELESLLRKDSLDMTEEDRQLIRRKIEADPCPRIVVTHGTDTMIQTAKALRGIPDKTIVLTGSMQPARFKSTDAAFNVGVAIGAAQVLPPGVYIAMNGQVFDPEKARKNAAESRFECA